MMKKTPRNSNNSDNFKSTVELTDNVELQSPEYDEKEYNPYEHRDVQHPNSDFGSLVHLLKSSLGSGIFAMPNAMRNSGLIVGIIGTVIMGAICTHCVHILVKISYEMCKKEKVPSMSFAETCAAAFRQGPKTMRKFANFVKEFVDWALVATCIGTACVYVVMMSESFHKVMEHYYPETNLDPKLYIVIFMFPLMLLGQIRSLKFLVPFSLIANILLLVTLAIIMSYIFIDLPPVDDKLEFTSMAQMPLFISTVIFAMEGIGIVMPIENQMKKPHHFLGCPGVLNVTMFIVISLYTIIGVFGYLRYGDDVGGNITQILDPNDVQAQIAKICIGLAIFFTYGLEFYVPMDIIFSKTERKQNPKYHNITQIIVRILCCIFTIVIALVVPQLDLLISFVGAVFYGTLGLFVPAIIEIVSSWHDLGFLYWKLIKDTIIAIFAIVALVSGAYLSIEEMVNSSQDNQNSTMRFRIYG